MISAPISPDEDARLRALDHYRLVGLGREPAFDRITALASDLFDVPISLVSIIGTDMQCFRGACGIESSGTPRDVAFCAFAILEPGVMVVEDAAEDQRFHDNPLVTGEPYIRFYAGAPLRVSSGEPLGTLCLIDVKPRTFNNNQRRLLAKMAQSVVDLIELRVGSLAAEDSRKNAIEQHELLQLTVENVSEGVALVDENLRMTLWNEAFMSMFGYAPGLVAEGADAASLMRITAERGELGPGDPAQIVAAFVQSITSTESRRIEIQRNDGRVLDIWRKSIAGGRFIMTARDVTDERQTARLKDELVSTVSHELRTPLTAISGSLGLLAAAAAGALPSKAENLVKIAHKNCDRLIRLVNDLLDMDKLQSGSAEFHFAETDLGQLLAEAIEENWPYAQQLGATMKLELPERSVNAIIDPHRIRQVLSNLISNAAKFSPLGSEIGLRLRAEQDWARISVSDQGPGIPPEFRERLFGRFAQAGGSSLRGQAGTGLGLAISKSIIENHGGKIELDDDVKQGATFDILLPLGAKG